MYAGVNNKMGMDVMMRAYLMMILRRRIFKKDSLEKPPKVYDII